MKLLILYIYSNEEWYFRMQQIQRLYCHKFKNVHSYFIQFREQTNEIETENDMIYVKGQESFMGITSKTLKAIEYMLSRIVNIDYVIRTNISTIINIPELLRFCESLPNKNVYTSGNMLVLKWLDHFCGIVDESLWGTRYASGTSIIMSNDVADELVKNQHLIRHDVIDDVTIGVFIKNHVPDAYREDMPIAKFVHVPNELNLNEIDKDCVFFRNRNNREYDIRNMHYICRLMYYV